MTSESIINTAIYKSKKCISLSLNSLLLLNFVDEKDEF